MTAAWIFVLAFAACEVLILASSGAIELSRYLGYCGMKMRYGLPCPTCGFTSAALAFFRGDIFEAFYIQPAGALLCVCLILTVFLAFITAVFGVYSSVLKRIGKSLKIRYIILVVLIILGSGWAVTLARALALRQ